MRRLFFVLTVMLFGLSLAGCASTGAQDPDTTQTDGAGVQKEDSFTPDGKKIVHVAIPKGYYYQMEFHAKKYNQDNDRISVEVERFDDSLELYLGKGNRPDIIMFNDQTEIEAYVEKKALVDILPMFEKQKKYSLDDVILKARELLGAESGNAMYAMSGRFRLLLRVSDGTEYDADGRCDSISYLKWYDNFLTENEIIGMSRLEDFLYANVSDFFEEDTAEAFFTSEEFREFMTAYKEVYDHHKGDLDWNEMMDIGYKEREIARGPRWHASYSALPDMDKEGIPGADGKDHAYMRLDYPMSILSTSDCKEEAFDFIMYYNSQEELLMKGDSEGSYGKSGTTPAIFSVYEKMLKEQIYESKRPYITLDGVEYFFTEEQNARLKDLIDRSVSGSKAQGDIYNMLMEEMDAYLNGEKTLDSVCEIVQNRAQLYLKERE